MALTLQVICSLPFWHRRCLPLGSIAHFSFAAAAAAGHVCHEFILYSLYACHVSSDLLKAHFLTEIFDIIKKSMFLFSMPGKISCDCVCSHC